MLVVFYTKIAVEAYAKHMLLSILWIWCHFVFINASDTKRTQAGKKRATICIHVLRVSYGEKMQEWGDSLQSKDQSLFL